MFRLLYNRFLINFHIHKIFLQYHKEVVRLMSGKFRQKIGDKYISFARKWMNYVLTKCESGRGTRPRYDHVGCVLHEPVGSVPPSGISHWVSEQMTRKGAF